MNNEDIPDQTIDTPTSNTCHSCGLREYEPTDDPDVYRCPNCGDTYVF